MFSCINLSPDQKLSLVNRGISRLHDKIGSVEASKCIPMLQSSFSDTLTLISGRYYIWYNRPINDQNDYTSGCVECQ